MTSMTSRRTPASTPNIHWLTAGEGTILSTTRVWTGNRVYLCPDLLDHRRIGAADNPRGHVVRAFFWLMRAWPVKPATYPTTGVRHDDEEVNVAVIKP